MENGDGRPETGYRIHKSGDLVKNSITKFFNLNLSLSLSLKLNLSVFTRKNKTISLISWLLKTDINKMNKRKIILFIDAIINLVLGVLLLAFSERIITFLGVPSSDTYFYPNILGGVLFGIGIALLIECYRKKDKMIGLGLGGAIAINLCGGTVLTLWLLLGNLSIPSGGKIFLWCIAVILIVISSVELLIYKHRK